MYGFSGNQSARDLASLAVPMSPQVPGMDMGCRLRFGSSCEHRTRVWDAEYKGFLVMYLW